MSGKLYRYAGAVDPEAYERLNRCTDPERLLEVLTWSIAPIDDRMVLDIGAGSGFHAARYAETARHVFAAEPDTDMLEQIRRRVIRDGLRNVTILAAKADQIPIADGAIDIAYARFAYFFGTEDCLPGISEVRRVLKPGGHFFIIDTNPDRGTFGEIARGARPSVFHDGYVQEHTEFYAAHGFSHHTVDTVLRAPNRDVLEQVLRMEFPEQCASFLPGIEGTELSYSMSVYHVRG